MTKDEALKLALEALDCICSPLHVREITKIGNAMKAIHEALAQSKPEQEPVTLQINSIPPFKNPPNDVIDAAFHVSNWAQRNNWTKWRIGKCCSVDYTTPPQRKPLTDEEFSNLVVENLGPHALTGGKMSVYDAFLIAVRATEAAHGIKE